MEIKIVVNVAYVVDVANVPDLVNFFLICISMIILKMTMMIMQVMLNMTIKST